MPDMPEHIAKGAILKRVDEFSRDPIRLRELLNALKASSNPNVADIAKQFRLISPSEHRHLVNDWFGNWWQDAQPVQPIVAQGFIVAIEQALLHRLPLDCYWICYGERGAPCCRSEVEFSCGVSNQQITVMLHTPAPEILSIERPELTESEPIYVVKRDDRGQIVTIQPDYALTPDYAAVPIHQ